MVYVSSISIKGPLGVVWLAAHLDRQLKRPQLDEISITGSVDAIINTEFPQLRLSSQLLLGVVRIYTKKVGYLFKECNEALVSIRDVAHKPRGGQAGTSDAAGVAPREAITLPDNLELEELNIDISVPTQAAPPMDLRMGASTSMAGRDDMDGMFGVHLSGPNTQQFEDLDGEIPFDLAIDDLHRMQTEPEAAGAGPGMQPPDEQVHGRGMEADMVDINFELELNLDETEAQEQQQPQHAEEPHTEDRAAGAQPDANGAPPRAAARTEEEQDEQQETQPTQTQPQAPETPEAPKTVRRSSRQPASADASPGEHTEGSSQGQEGAGPPHQRRVTALAKRKVQVDEDKDEHGVKRTQIVLPGQLLRHLLDNRSSLLAERGKAFKAASAAGTTDPPESHAGEESIIAALKPSSSSLYASKLHWGLAEPLQELYCVALDLLNPLELGNAPASPAKKACKRRAADAPDSLKAKAGADPEAEPAPEQDRAPATPGEDAGPPHQADHDIGAPTPEQPDFQQQDRADQGVAAGTPAGGLEGGVFPEDLGPASMAADAPEPGPMADATAHQPEVPGGSKRHREEDEEEEDEDEHMLDGELEALPAHVRTDLTQGGGQDDEEAAHDNVAAKSFTRRTRVVVAALQAAVQHSGGKHAGGENGKRHKPSAEAPPLHLSSFVKGHNRLHASRWFFELLVLKAKGVVELEQPKPYSDVAIHATAKLDEVTATAAAS